MLFNNRTLPMGLPSSSECMHSPWAIILHTLHLICTDARLHDSKFLPQRYGPQLHSLLNGINVGYLDPCTTSFSLYSHSGHLPSCTIGLPRPCTLHSAGTCSPSSSDESPPRCICSASSSSLCICSTIMGIISPSSACPCGSVSV